MSRSTADLVSSYVHSLRWQLPLTVLAVIALWAFDVGNLRNHGLGPLLLLGVGFLVVLSPLLWLRYEFVWQHDKQLAVLMLVAIVWMAVGTLVMFGLFALVVD